MEELSRHEDFIREVDEWVETIQILARRWGGEGGGAIEAYAEQMRASIRRFREASPASERKDPE